MNEQDQDNLAIMQTVNPDELAMLETALRNSPIQWLGINIIPKLYKAYHAGVPGVYLIFIDYGGLSLTGIVVAQDLELRVWLDYKTVMHVMRQILEGQGDTN